MKFGKHLEARTLELPEYAGHFINYKQLKKLIKSLAAVPQFNDIRSDDIERTLQENKTSFFFRLERELEKVNSFYLEKESDLKIRLDILIKKKNDAFSKNRLGSKESIAYVTLYEGFKRFARDLDRLEQFIELNQTGFSKVLKKWDKRSKSHTKELYLSKAVSVQPVFNRDEISQLNDLCANSLLELDAKVEGEQVIRFESDKKQSIAELSNLRLYQNNETSTNGGAAATPNGPIPIDDNEIDELYSEFLTICESSNVDDLLGSFTKRVKSSINSALKLTKLFFLSIPTQVPDEILEKFYNDASNLINLIQCDEISQRNILHEACSNKNQERAFIINLVISKDLHIWNAKDISGRLPIHYAAELGKYEIIKTFATKEDISQYINAADYDSKTPLVLAISDNHFNTTKTLLELGANPSPTNTETNPQYLPLNVACKVGNYRIVELLLSYPNSHQKDAEGLLPLHVVAKMGQRELVELLVSKNADPNELDGFNKWSPIFYAVSEGHVKTTEKLLQNGAKIDIKDEKNNSPLFYASWEGHVGVLNVLIQYLHQKSNQSLLSPLKEANSEQQQQQLPLPPSFALNPDNINIDTIPDLSLPPPIIPLRRYGHNFLEQKIFVQLSFPPGRSTLKLNELSSALSSPGRIVISSKISDVVPRNLILPITDTDNIVAFQIDSLEEFQIDFEIFPSFGTKLIAKTSALSNVFTNVLNDGLKNEVTLPLFDGRLKTIGELNFQFHVIHPYSGIPLEISKYDTYWKSTGGNNMDSAVQNVLSFVTSSSLSGEYLKVLVTLLSDGTPVVGPSWNLLLSGTSIPLFQLSTKQLKSLTGYDQRNFSEVLKKHYDNESSYLRNVKEFIRENFLLLDDFLTLVPEFVNLNVEVLFPTENEISELPLTLPESTNLNKFVDAILTSVFEHVRASRKTNNNSSKTRSLVFSSNVQSVCSILNWKQPNYPVFFSVSGIYFNHEKEVFEKQSANGYPVSLVSNEDPVTRSIKEATRFATLNNLLGIMVPNELLKLIPDLVEVIRSRGLILVASEKNLLPDVDAHTLVSGLKNDINGARYDGILTFKGDIDM